MSNLQALWPVSDNTSDNSRPLTNIESLSFMKIGDLLSIWYSCPMTAVCFHSHYICSLACNCCLGKGIVRKRELGSTNTRQRARKQRVRLAIKNAYTHCSVHGFHPPYIYNLPWQIWHSTQCNHWHRRYTNRCSNVLTKGLMKKQQMKKPSYVLALKNIAPKKFRGFIQHKLGWTHVVHFNSSTGSRFRHFCFMPLRTRHLMQSSSCTIEAVFYYPVWWSAVPELTCCTNTHSANTGAFSLLKYKII